MSRAAYPGLGREECAAMGGYHLDRTQPAPAQIGDVRVGTVEPLSRYVR